MKVNIKKLHHNAIIPNYATDGSAAFDLYAATAENSDIIDFYDDKEWAAEFGTGLAFEVPEGHVMLVFSRSGHGFNYGASLVNSVGVIDSDYRGEVKVKLDALIPATVGYRIAQAIILPIPRITFQETDELTTTERGTNGFGSTGR